MVTRNDLSHSYHEQHSILFQKTSVGAVAELFAFLQFHSHLVAMLLPLFKATCPTMANTFVQSWTLAPTSVVLTCQYPTLYPSCH